MTDLRKQVFQAIEQYAFNYNGDKDDLEKLIDVVVELIQKREAEAIQDLWATIEKHENFGWRDAHETHFIEEIILERLARLKPTQVDKGDSDE